MQLSKTMLSYKEFLEQINEGLWTKMNILFKINVKDLVLYQDPNYTDGYYTYDSIPISDLYIFH